MEQKELISALEDKEFNIKFFLGTKLLDLGFEKINLYKSMILAVGNEDENLRNSIVDYCVEVGMDSLIKALTESLVDLDEKNEFN